MTAHPLCLDCGVTFCECDWAWLNDRSAPVASPDKAIGADILDSLNERPSAVGALKSHVIHSSPSTPTTATSGGGQ